MDFRPNTGVLMAQKDSKGLGPPMVQKSTALQQWPSMYNEVLEHLYIRCAPAGHCRVAGAVKRCSWSCKVCHAGVRAGT